jgi:glycerol-3-phosphate acyltransferase PlsX
MSIKKKLVVAIDAMGGDNAPDEIVKGAALALRENADLKIILVGVEKILKEKIRESNDLKILGASEVISNDESPAHAVRNKKDSSIVKALNLIKDEKADGFVSAGSTGAVLLASTIILKKNLGISRPTLGALMPNINGYSLLLDSGANVDCKANLLEQFAKLGFVYMKNVMNIKNPRVGLLNIGVESEKGNSLTKETYKLLSLNKDKINFIGNIEAREIPFGVADVIICDGFVGNIIIKYTEGFAKSLFKIIKQEVSKKFSTSVGATLLKPAFINIKKRFDYKEVGGAPLLGFDSVIIKAHGSSDRRAIKNAINQCLLSIRNNMSLKIREILRSNN